MRLLHTSDWHLGHTLHDEPRDAEHDRFLAWLLDTLEAEAADALVIAGDIFDGANPTNEAQERYFRFLADCRKRLPALEVLAVGGNHDSAGRLDAPGKLLDAVGVSVVGGLPRRADGSIDADRAIVPLRQRGGEVAAWAVAVPFLRPADLPLGGADDTERTVTGTRAVYAALFEEARRRRRPGQALIATGHCYMVGGAVSELSERRIQRGNQDALPVDVFPDDVAYVALGHLHKAQPVGGREHIRYSGSPLPLSLSERGYRHQVYLVELDGEKLARVRSIPVPRTVEMLAVPETHQPLAEVLAALAALPRSAPPDGGDKPFLEVRVRIDGFQPGLRRTIEDAVDGAYARLVAIDTKSDGAERALADIVDRRKLKDLDPREVFEQCWRRANPTEDLPPDIRDAFFELLETVQHGDER